MGTVLKATNQTKYTIWAFIGRLMGCVGAARENPPRNRRLGIIFWMVEKMPEMEGRPGRHTWENSIAHLTICTTVLLIITLRLIFYGLEKDLEPKPPRQTGEKPGETKKELEENQGGNIP